MAVLMFRGRQVEVRQLAFEPSVTTSLGRSLVIATQVNPEDVNANLWTHLK